MAPSQQAGNDAPFSWRKAAAWTGLVLAASAVAVAAFREPSWLLPAVLVACSTAVLGMWWMQRAWRRTLDSAVEEWSQGPQRSAEGERPPRHHPGAR